MEFSVICNCPRQRQQGFTLIELIVVIVILGLLGSIIAPKFLGENRHRPHY